MKKSLFCLVFLVLGCSGHENLSAGTVVFTRIDARHYQTNPSPTLVPDRCYIAIAGHLNGKVVVEEYQTPCDTGFFSNPPQAGDLWMPGLEDVLVYDSH